MPRGSVRSGSWISLLEKAPNLEAGEGEAERRPQAEHAEQFAVGQLPRERRHHRRGREAGRRPARPDRHRRGDDQQRDRHPRPDHAQRLQPAPGLEALDADADREPEKPEHEDQGEEPVVAQAREEPAEHRRRVRRREEQQGGEVEQVVDPEAPAAQRAAERAEGAMDPGVDAALLRILLRQHRDGEGQRHEEGEPRQHPQEHRRRADAGPARDPAQPGDGDDGEEDDVPEAEDPLQFRRGRAGRVVGHRLACSTSSLRAASEPVQPVPISS